MKIKEIREACCMSRRKFSEYFNIPERTLQNWELGIREAPKYVVELIEYKAKKALINIQLSIDNIENI